MTIHESDFRRVMAELASGVTVLSLRDADGADQGMTVSAFTSLSLDPPLVLACVAVDATLARPLADAEFVGVSILGADQEAISRRFAESETDRFAGVSRRRGRTGVALLEGALAHLETRIVARHPGGDHTILVCEVLEGATAGGAPLIYHRGRYLRVTP